MRKLLVTAVALAPLAMAANAHAQTVVDNNRTTPIATATANSGVPANITIKPAGQITLNSGTAVTLNSNNNVTAETGSRITMENSADGSTAILAQGGFTGSLDVSSVINVTDSITEYKDTDNDGDLDGPVAAGADRYGIRVTGPGALDGDAVFRAGSITVHGNDSAGISLESDLTGDFRSYGGISVLGADSYGIHTTGDIAGDTRVGGTVNVTGENAVGIAYDGNVDGAVLIDATVSVTGFRYPVRPTSPEAVAKLDADDLLIGGSAVRIGGNVGGGVLLDRPTTLTDDDKDDANDDLDGDGVIDSRETTANLSSLGSAPALAIGSTTQTVTLGQVGVGAEAYGLINRGTVSGVGVYDGVISTGLRVGVAGGQAVLIEGGIRNDGSISAASTEANATAVLIGNGATTPTFVNNSALSATVLAEGSFAATALLVEAGGNLASFNNDGAMAAMVGGEKADAVAIWDRSGTLSDIVNSGSITAQVTRTVGPGDTGNEPITGRQIAMDLSANTTGVTLMQFGVLAAPDSPAADTDGDGVSDVDEPRITGNIILGSGDDVVDIRNGQVLGGINFGAGSDHLIITGGADVRGGIANTSGQLQIDVTNGILDARQGGVTTISGLTVGADGALIVTIDPTTGLGGFAVTGDAVLTDGAEVGVRFNELVRGTREFVLIDAGNLNYGAVNTGDVQNSPYLYEVSTRAGGVGGNQVIADVRTKTVAEMQLIQAETDAFAAVFEALDDDPALLNAFLSQTGRDGFINLYEQMLPDHSGGPLLALASGVDAVTRALSGRNQAARLGETSAWLQEINFYAEKDQDEAYGFESEGFGFAGGVERGTRMGAFGISTAFTSTDLKDPQAQAEELLSVSLIELGLYWRAQGQNWTTWARGAGGYAWFDSTRSLVAPGLFRTAESDWTGYTIAAAAGASYERHFGRFSIRPEASLEYFMLSEGDRSESGGGDGFDLGIDEREGHLFTSTAVVNIGMGFGENNWLRPELRLGWRQNISFDGGTTTGRFLSGGPDFMLHADSIEGGGPIIGLRLNVGNELGFLSIEGDAEFIDDYVRYALLLRASFRF
jgi:uncharacterized protein with beta-barrel porin domain